MYTQQPTILVTRAEPGQRVGYSQVPVIDIYHIQLDDNDPETKLKAHTNTEGSFVIDDLEVAEGVRRNGLGKRMLRIALSEAESSGSVRITSTIISATCLAAMRGVFGAESIEVLEEGSFDPLHDDAAAFLDYEIGQD